MVKVHRRRRLPGAKSRRNKGQHRGADINGAAKADLKEHLGHATSGHEKLAKKLAAEHDSPGAGAPAETQAHEPLAAMAPAEAAAPDRGPVKETAHGPTERPKAMGEAAGA